MKFPEKARKLREARNLSTRMLEEEVGVSHSQIVKYENGQTEPTLSVLRAYSKFFGVTLDYLCRDEEEDVKKR